MRFSRRAPPWRCPSPPALASLARLLSLACSLACSTRSPSLSSPRHAPPLPAIRTPPSLPAAVLARTTRARSSSSAQPALACLSLFPARARVLLLQIAVVPLPLCRRIPRMSCLREKCPQRAQGTFPIVSRAAAAVVRTHTADLSVSPRWVHGFSPFLLSYILRVPSQLHGIIRFPRTRRQPIHNRRIPPPRRLFLRSSIQNGYHTMPAPSTHPTYRAPTDISSPQTPPALSPLRPTLLRVALEPATTTTP